MPWAFAVPASAARAADAPAVAMDAMMKSRRSRSLLRLSVEILCDQKSYRHEMRMVGRRSPALKSQLRFGRRR